MSNVRRYTANEMAFDYCRRDSIAVEPFPTRHCRGPWCDDDAIFPANVFVYLKYFNP